MREQWSLWCAPWSCFEPLDSCCLVAVLASLLSMQKGLSHFVFGCCRLVRMGPTSLLGVYVSFHQVCSSLITTQQQQQQQSSNCL